MQNEDLDILCTAEHWNKENEIKVMPVDNIKLSPFFREKYKEEGLSSLDKWTIEGKIECYGVKIEASNTKNDSFHNYVFSPRFNYFHKFLGSN